MSGQAKHIASVSLGIMTAGFAATLPFQGGSTVQLLQSGFEAGLVGGLADWFAVSALFRHPMGIPIPHTALLPRNRKKLTQALVSAIEQNLLNKESIEQKIKTMDFTTTLLQIFEREIQSEDVKKGLVGLSQQIVLSISPESIIPWFEMEAKHFLASADMLGFIRMIIDQALEHEYDEKGLDFLLNRAEQWAAQPENRDKLGRIALSAIEKIELGGFMQFAVNAFVGYLSEEKLGGIVQNLIISNVAELRTAGHPKRTATIEYIRGELRGMKNNPSLLAAMEAWRNKLLESIDLHEKLTRLFATLQQRLLDFIVDSKYTDELLCPTIERLLQQLRSDPVIKGQCENWIQRQLSQLVEDNHQKIGKLVEENVNKLDNEALIYMMEEKIGGDLQWIRVNGAICGFLIGLVLGGIRLLF